MRLSYTIEIHTSPEKVWYWLGTPERAMVWQTSVSKTEILQETPNMIGTTFRETVQDSKGSIEMHGEIIDYRENRVLAMHLSGKFNVVNAEWRLEGIDGSTRLTVHSNIRFKSFLKVLSKILWPFFKKQVLKQLRGELTKLKELSEQRT